MNKQNGGFFKRFGRSRHDRTAIPDLDAITDHLALDLDAVSNRDDEPAFMAPPDGAKPYHGFRLLEDVEVMGFTLGAITDFSRYPGLETGDGFVEAPDGARAGLEWRLSNEPYLLMMAPPSARRWGVWLVGFTRPMNSFDAARANLRDLQPALEEKWREWHTAKFAGEFNEIQLGRLTKPKCVRSNVAASSAKRPATNAIRSLRDRSFGCRRLTPLAGRPVPTRGPPVP